MPTLNDEGKLNENAERKKKEKGRKIRLYVYAAEIIKGVEGGEARLYVCVAECRLCAGLMLYRAPKKWCDDKRI